jgi:hypothetical protein
MTAVEIRVKLQRVLGAASIFKQGGSLRVILPKRSFAFLKMPREPDESDFATVILIATDKGILMRPLSDFLQDEEMKNL